MYLLERIGQPKEAIKVLAQILELAPEKSDLHFHYIKLLLMHQSARMAQTELLRLEARLKIKFSEPKQLVMTQMENAKL
jgi:thioredoxin-like negative regulator of GroEL